MISLFLAIVKTKSSVTWHYKDQIKDIVDECLNYKNKEIYFLEVSNGGKVQQRILNGIKETYFQYNKEFLNVIKVPDSYKETYPIMQEHFKKHPSGYYIAYRDSIAIAALNAAMDLKMDVPEDVEIMAVIGTKYSELTRPKLSSFDMNMRQLGFRGMEVLASLIDDNFFCISTCLLISLNHFSFSFASLQITLKLLISLIIAKLFSNRVSFSNRTYFKKKYSLTVIF